MMEDRKPRTVSLASQSLVVREWEASGTLAATLTNHAARATLALGPPEFPSIDWCRMWKSGLEICAALHYRATRKVGGRKDRPPAGCRHW
jgi:hypothetical protein